MISHRRFRNRVLDLVLVLVVAACVARSASAVQIKLQRTLKHSSDINTIAFSPDGKLLASGTNDGIRLWDARTGKLKSVWKWRDDEIRAIAFSPNGKLLASASNDDLVRIWKVSSRRVLHTLRSQRRAQTSSVAFSPDSFSLAVGSSEQWDEGAARGELTIWDVRTGKLKRTLYRDQFTGVDAVAWSPNGKTLVALVYGSDGGFNPRFWNTRTWKIQQVGTKQPVIYSMVFSGDTLITVGPGNNRRTVFRFFNLRNGRLSKIVRDKERFTRDVALSPDNKLLATASTNNSSELTRIDLRDALTGKVVQSAGERPKNIFSLAFSKDGLLAAGSLDGTIYLWRVK